MRGRFKRSSHSHCCCCVLRRLAACELNKFVHWGNMKRSENGKDLEKWKPQPGLGRWRSDNNKACWNISRKLLSCSLSPNPTSIVCNIKYTAWIITQSMLDRYKDRKLLYKCLDPFYCVLDFTSEAVYMKDFFIGVRFILTSVIADSWIVRWHMMLWILTFMYLLSLHGCQKQKSTLQRKELLQLYCGCFCEHSCYWQDSEFHSTYLLVDFVQGSSCWLHTTLVNFKEYITTVINYALYLCLLGNNVELWSNAIHYLSELNVNFLYLCAMNCFPWLNTIVNKTDMLFEDDVGVSCIFNDMEFFICMILIF